MGYTYKLDAKGIPYRVTEKFCGAEMREDCGLASPIALGTELLAHEGALRGFRLYLF